MKKDELDLDILENADTKTIETLSESYKALSDSDVSRLFARSEKLFKNRAAESDGEYSSTVSGVEVYRRPVWKKLLAAAASLVLIGSAVTGGALFYKNNAEVKLGGDTLTIEEMIASAEEMPYIPYEFFLENKKFLMTIDNFTSEGNPLQLSGGPYPDAAVAKPFRSLLVDGDSVVATLQNWMFPVVYDGKYLGFANCGMSRAGSDSPEPSYWGGQMFAPQLNEAVQKGSLALFTTVDGTYGIYEDNTVVTLLAGAPYSGNITFEQVDQEYNLVTADSVNNIVYQNGSIVWENVLSPPDDFFEEAPLTDELRGKNIIDMTPIYEFAYDYSVLDNITANADNIIIGRVNGISYKALTYESGGTPYTQIDVTVSEDAAGKLQSGEKVSIYMLGGYISMRDRTGDTLYKTGGKYGDGISMTEEEIDNTYYHEIIDSGEVPIAGNEYAFFVTNNEDGTYSAPGHEYGILYKYDKVYVRRDSNGLSYFTLDQLTGKCNFTQHDWGIALTAENVTSSGLTLKCTQSGGKDFSELKVHGNFVIQQLIGSSWVNVNELPQTAEVNWVTDTVPLNDTTSWKINWEWLYGKLTEGRYRIGKEFLDFRSPEDFDTEMIYAEFTV